MPNNQASFEWCLLSSPILRCETDVKHPILSRTTPMSWSLPSEVKCNKCSSCSKCSSCGKCSSCSVVSVLAVVSTNPSFLPLRFYRLNSPLPIRHKNINWKGQSTSYVLIFCSNYSFLTYVFWKRKTGFGKAMKRSAGCGIFVKRECKCVNRIPHPLPPPSPDPEHSDMENVKILGYCFCLCGGS